MLTVRNQGGPIDRPLSPKNNIPSTKKILGKTPNHRRRNCRSVFTDSEKTITNFSDGYERDPVGFRVFAGLQ